MEKEQQGYTDSPVSKKDDDTLGIKVYVDSLSDFILKCATPMTIAIQGDWGSGKTSIMSLIKEKISDNVESIWFNTWWFSQFEMQEYLSINLLNHFISKLGGDKAAKTKLANFFKATGRTIMIGAVNKLAGDVSADKLSENMRGQDFMEFGNELNNLKDLLAETVDKKLKKADGKKDRVVFFIDDLDRLPPEKAVELLEVLKIFLDIPKCVFILVSCLRNILT
jgi:predicted KAP-like P-loop ATPase